MLLQSSNCTTIEETGDSTIADLFECLPMVENLSIWFHIILVILIFINITTWSVIIGKMGYRQN